jgi:hypothetical protein
LHFCPLENHLMLVNLKVAIKKERKKPWFKFPAGLWFPIPAETQWLFGSCCVSSVGLVR